MVVLKRSGDPSHYNCGTDTYDVHAIANVERKVPTEWITADGCGLTDSFANYARPLIMGELLPLFVNGVPQHLTRKG
jgi:6-phosphofructokinase 1